MSELVKIKEQLEEMRGKFDTLSQPPTTDPNAIQSNGKSYAEISSETKWELAKKLSTWNPAELQRGMAAQMVKGTEEGAGIPYEVWTSGDPNARQKFEEGLTKAQATGAVPAASGWAAGSILVRQDLEPFLYATFVRRFPAFDRIAKKPANGVVHAYNRVTALPTAAWVAETGTAGDTQATYQRAQTNVAVMLFRVGTSLKLQFAYQAGGGGQDPNATELQMGITAAVKKLQETFFTGNASVSGATDVTVNEEGAYDQYAFDGIRQQFGTFASGTVTNQGSETITQAINTAAVKVMDNGGFPSLLVMDSTNKKTLDEEQLANVRYNENRVEVAAGIMVNTINTVGGSVPILTVPGNPIGTYTTSLATDGVDETGVQANSNALGTARDIYLIDETALSFVYLGSEMPTILELPVGIANNLSKLYMIYAMLGLECNVTKFQSKIRTGV